MSNRGYLMGKVIDIVDRIKSTKRSPTTVKSKASVMDITEVRKEMINSERRTVKRTILTEFIGAFVILPDQGLLKVSVYDISDNGVAFDIDTEKPIFKENEEVAMRVYLNYKTYFGFVVKVQNSRFVPSEGVVRHGTHFMKGTLNDVALHHFVKFIETVSASLKTDDGDIQVSNIS